MTAIPTRWRTTLEEQLADATRKVEAAAEHLQTGDGGRALQHAYPAVVAAATVRVWLNEPPWEAGLPPSPAQMQQRVRDAFPNLFSALALLDIKDVLTSPWTSAAAAPYVHEARAYLAQTQERLTACLAPDSR